MVCLSGLEDSFATGAETLLRRLAGLRVSESTVQRATEAAGERLAEAQHAGQTFGPSTPWAWHKDADGKTVGYVSSTPRASGNKVPAGQSRRANGVHRDD
ncbi:hypothetical protein [Fimbriiglobus ruber]|uniref:Uncharacterized protein n=1 Tax=Fimbriiglobus ruber TaxID=1908690 RepID=A0A225D2G0_9BACT|nr:hypothetical protein [Fimbriiglobus ruber]OWK35771.1 hypothetical protein FRUB_08334 [Fimbriiglobus ruber]